MTSRSQAIELRITLENSSNSTSTISCRDVAFWKRRLPTPSSFLIPNIVRSQPPSGQPPRSQPVMKLSKLSIARKTTRYFAVLVLAGIVILPAAVRAQSSPEDTLRSFYKWYLHELNAERSPRWTSAKVSNVSSTRLRKWFQSKTGREWDADYFIDAQDLDKDWETNVAISKPAITGNRADVEVTLGPKTPAPNAIGQRVLKIKMVKESGGWKIDRVNGH